MRNVAVVGGGLGGMAAALVLARNPELRVTLYESSHRLGGKAGASMEDGRLEDHGYHIFPPWYANAYAVIDELRIRGNLVDMPRFHQLRADEYPKLGTLTNFTSFRFAWKNLRSGAIPVADLLLYYYSVVDLISQPYSRRAFLDQISVNGFVRSKFYRTESVSQQYQDLLLKFVSVPSYKVSAMTVQKMLRYWVKNAVPMSRVLLGDMHTTFIAPWEARLRELGCEIVPLRRLKKLRSQDGRITALELVHVKPEAASAEGRETSVVDVDDVVLAMPPIDAAKLLDEETHRIDPELAKIKYLNAEAMAALSLYLDRKVDDLPNEHINLLGSRYALTLIDVSQHWPGLEHTVLNVIASDVQELEGVSEDYATGEIVKELKRYLPFLDENRGARITYSHFQPHFREPLVMNEVGAWPFRPKATTGIANLYVAGTHCQHEVDMTSMEGAVISGLQAANALLRDRGLGSGWEILTPKSSSRFWFGVLRWLLLPGAAVVRGWVWLWRGRK